MSNSFATPGSSVHEISQARRLEWVDIFFSRGSSRPRDQTLHPLHRLADSLPLGHQFLSVSQFVRLLATPRTTTRQASLSITNFQSWFKLMPIELWCHSTISSSVIPSPPALNLSQHQGLFKWVSSSHHVAKVLEFQLQHQSF